MFFCIDCLFKASLKKIIVTDVLEIHEPLDELGATIPSNSEMPEFVKTQWQPAEQKDYGAAIQTADDETKRLFARIRELEELDANGSASGVSGDNSAVQSSMTKSKQQEFIPPTATLGILNASSSSSSSSSSIVSNLSNINNNNNELISGATVSIETVPVSSVVVERDPNSKKRSSIANNNNDNRTEDDDEPLPAAPKRVSKFKAALAQTRNTK